MYVSLVTGRNAVGSAGNVGGSSGKGESDSNQNNASSVSETLGGNRGVDDSEEGGGSGGGGGGSIVEYRAGIGGRCGDGGGGGSSVVRSLATRRTSGVINTADDEHNNTGMAVRKSAETRPSRTTAVRKLQKCLSTTTTSHYDADTYWAAARAGSSSTTSSPHSHVLRSNDARGYSSSGHQPSSNYQNILINTRQYSSLGSIVISRTIVFNDVSIASITET
uniref:Uncharacterized protein n=1 Tax=Vespula pensylvanica TaxID=30213 RepID=A0A834UBM0_VESPE|nr:hypothetical protein H0235_005804 [Vespula pensylvanica]